MNKSKKFLDSRVIHFYGRGNNRMTLFKEDRDYKWFIRKLSVLEFEDFFQVISFVLMPNHFHFLVFLKEDSDVSKLFQRWLLAYAKYFNRKYAHSGHVFENNYQSRIFENENSTRNVCAYIHLNPVRAELVKKPGDWKYSNYNQILKSKHNRFCYMKFYLDLFGSIENYRQYIKQLSNEKDFPRVWQNWFSAEPNQF